MGGSGGVLDVVIIGGGPAGSTAGRLLARWGHSVAILAAPPDNRPGWAECLPPSNRKVFQFLGILDAIEQAGFFRTTGNTVWWGSDGQRVEPYPEGWGYQVLRRDFDHLLLDLAQAAGAGVRAGKAFGIADADGPRVMFQPVGRRSQVPVPARFILDCSGRAGILARLAHLKQARRAGAPERLFHVKQGQPGKSRTVALCGIWRNEPDWGLPDESHTLVEAYEGGWAWSVPVSPSVRHVAFMIDPGDRKMARGKDLGAAYLAEMAQTRAFRDIFRRGTMETAPWGRDASVYSSSRYCGPGFLLAGDAGASIDPLSSFGVKKAMVSAWVGAVVTNTWLRHPAMRQAALQFFDDRERQVYESYRERSAAWYRNAAAPPADPDREAARRALEDLKARPSICLRRGAGVRMEQRPAIEGNEVALRDVLVVPALPESLDFIEDVSLPRLVELAERHSQVPDVFEAYNRVCPPVTLPAFLKALAILLAKGVLC
ncbi:MAG: tryptophan 7-halogenase [Acidobacteriia bacterium]|nr:tryptophan 7-halogenase [Terriglobia bacterium]